MSDLKLLSRTDEILFQSGWSPAAAAARVIGLPLDQRPAGWREESAAAFRAAAGPVPAAVQSALIAAAQSIADRMIVVDVLSKTARTARRQMLAESLQGVCLAAQCAAAVSLEATP